MQQGTTPCNTKNRKSQPTKRANTKMGEYAKSNKDGEIVKIGTCEDMYYLRADQLEEITAIDHSMDPWLLCASAMLADPPTGLKQWKMPWKSSKAFLRQPRRNRKPLRTDTAPAAHRQSGSWK